jgi:hypothetical protein
MCSQWWVKIWQMHSGVLVANVFHLSRSRGAGSSAQILLLLLLFLAFSHGNVVNFGVHAAIVAASIRDAHSQLIMLMPQPP